MPKEFKSFLCELRKKYNRTEHCVHRHSCVSNVVESFGYNFTIGLGVSFALTLAQNMSTVFSNPVKVLDKLLSKTTLRIPTFFGLMPFIYHTVRCAINRLPQRSHKYSNIVAGSASGLALLAFPNVSISMYVLWKGIEMVYRDLVRQGRVRPMPYGDLFLYTVSTAYVLWQIIIEPQAIRKGYLKFLLGLTGNRLERFSKFSTIKMSSLFTCTQRLNPQLSER
ncbi:hypothetical protein COOONC_08632 [Cooperia oncophora]